jgi:hypothetical protein
MLLEKYLAEAVLNYLLKNFEGENRFLAFPYAGYFKQGEKYICFDNKTFCCWVEESKNESMAIKWC